MFTSKRMGITNQSKIKVAGEERDSRYKLVRFFFYLEPFIPEKSVFEFCDAFVIPPLTNPPTPQLFCCLQIFPSSLSTTFHVI